MLESADALLRITSEIDIPQRSIRSLWNLSSVLAQSQADSVPAVTLTYSGAWDNPARRLDTSDLASYLTVRRIERDVRALEEAQAEAKAREADLALEEQAVRDAIAARENPPEMSESEDSPQSGTAEQLPDTPSVQIEPAPQPKPAPSISSSDQDSLEELVGNALRNSDTNLACLIWATVVRLDLGKGHLCHCCLQQ